MKNVSLIQLEDTKKKKLEQYKLDSRSISEFREKIKQVSPEESNRLGKELFELIFNKKFNDDYEKALELIYRGANIEYKENKKGLFSLLICARRNHLKTFLSLLRAGANVNQVNNYLTTPTMDSARYGNKEILELLILMGADVNAMCQDGDTALISAIRHKQKECVDILIKAQAHLNHRNISNESIFDIKDDMNLNNLKLNDESIIEPTKADTIEEAMKVIKEAEAKLNISSNNQETINLSFSVNLDFTLLSENQIFGEKRLEIFEKYGPKCVITDFSILLGGYGLSNNYTSEGNTLKNRTGWWWTKSPYCGKVRAVDIDGNRSWYYVNSRRGGARPALSYSSISSLSSNEMRESSGIKEIFYGEYPQTIVDENHSNELERVYNNGSLRTTGKNYTTDSVEYQEISTSFKARTHTEYEYNGSKYIRFIGDSNCDGEVLSDGRTIKKGNAYWVRVEPITWLVDEENDIVISKKILFSGIQFKNHGGYDGNFNDTFIKWFMDNYFSKEIIHVKQYNSDNEKNKQLHKVMVKTVELVLK